MRYGAVIVTMVVTGMAVRMPMIVILVIGHRCIPSLLYSVIV